MVLYGISMYAFLQLAGLIFNHNGCMIVWQQSAGIWEKQTNKLQPTCHTGPSESNRPRFKFLRSPEEAAAAIRGVLSADPRSVYRRTRCRDRLFFFTLDTADITCWFGQGFAEVLQVRPVEQHIASVWELLSARASELEGLIFQVCWETKTELVKFASNHYFQVISILRNV